jgi:hypothetical protein
MNRQEKLQHLSPAGVLILKQELHQGVFLRPSKILPPALRDSIDIVLPKVL